MLQSKLWVHCPKNAEVLCISFRVGKVMPKTPLVREAQQNYSLCSTTWYYSHETRLIFSDWNIVLVHSGTEFITCCSFSYFFLQRKVKESIFPLRALQVTRDVSLLSRWMAIDLYIRELDSLQFELSMNRCSDKLYRLAHEILEKGNSVLGKDLLQFFFSSQLYPQKVSVSSKY